MSAYTNPAGYDGFMGRWSARLAPHFVANAAITGGRVLDVGCGTGVLSRALLELDPKVQVIGIDLSPSNIEYAARLTSSPRARFQRSTAEALPFADASFHAALSLLVIQELADAPRAVKEMARVTRDGGCVGTCKWDFRDGLPMLSLFWRAAEAVAPQRVARRRAESGGRSGYDTLESLSLLWHGCGLGEVRTEVLEIEMEFTSFEDLWLPFLEGATGTAAFARDLDAANEGAVAARLREVIAERCGEGRFTLPARAWAVFGRVQRS